MTLLHTQNAFVERFLTDFVARTAKTFKIHPMPTFQKLSRAMTDAEVEKELKPGLCELGDVLAFLDDAPKECKDGYWNFFYFPSCVVCVFWVSGLQEWYVDTWRRGGLGWVAGSRVLSPATGSQKLGTVVLGSLTSRIEKLEEFEEKVRKFLII